jgi:hypothetical protein
VEAEQHRRPILLAMPTVVLPMSARGLEHRVAVVCALPPPPTRWRHVHRVVSRQVGLGKTGIGRQLCACCGVDDGAGAPIARQGFGTTAQEHVVEVAPPRPCREAPMPVGRWPLGQRVVGRPKRQALRARGMGGGVARQEAGAAMRAHERTPGLVA